MTTVRQEVRDAVIAALNDARDPDLPEATKRRWVPGQANRCPSIGVFFLQEQPRQIGGRHGGLVERPLQIGAQCVVAVSSPDLADDAVEPLLAHVVERLGSTTLSGLALDVEELGTKWEHAQMDRFYLAATMTWQINFQTRRDDLSQRQ